MGYQQFEYNTSKSFSLYNRCWGVKPCRTIISHFISLTLSLSLSLSLFLSLSLAFEQILKPNVLYKYLWRYITLRYSCILLLDFYQTISRLLLDYYQTIIRILLDYHYNII